MRGAARQSKGAFPAGRLSAKVLAFDRLRSDAAAGRVIELVAKARSVPVLLLLHKSRCTAEVAEARQLAMYVMHVGLQRTYEQIGRLFGRDRTTVSYACAQTEDRREDGAFDALVAGLEAQLTATTSEKDRLRAAG